MIYKSEKIIIISHRQMSNWQLKLNSLTGSRSVS